MQIDAAIEQFLQHRRNRNRSPETITHYGYYLKNLWLSWLTRNEIPHEFDAITLDRMVRYFTYLTHEHRNSRSSQAGLSPETVNGAWRTHRALWNFSYRREWITATQVSWFKCDEFIARPQIPTRVRPVLEDDLLAALLEACKQIDDPEQRARNRAIVLILAQSGMRISELTSMRLSRTRLDERSAIIMGKGRREEWVFWNIEAGSALKFYLRVRPSKVDEVWLRLSGHAMTPCDVRNEVSKLEQIAGISLPDGATVHCFRHRFAHKAIESGLDVSQTSQLLRHRDISTTMRYLRENKERLKTFHSRIKA